MARRLALNPYDPPMNGSDSNDRRALSNPAKPLLYVIGAFGLLQGVIGIPVGLFVGLQILSPAVAMLAFGSTAIWLGHRRYDRFGRRATIAWGVLAIILLLVAIGFQPPSMQDVAEIVFVALLLVVVGSVPAVALRKRSGSFA